MTTEIPSREEQFENIVDGLLSRGFAVTDHFLNDQETLRLLDSAHRRFAEGSFKKAGIGKNQQLDDRIRGDYIQWIDRQNLDPGCHFFLDAVGAMASYLNRSCYLGLRDMELHFAVYPPGTEYKRHFDVFKNTSARKLSVICYLNTDWKESDGGALRLFLPDKDGREEILDIYPFGGRMVCFQSELLEHAVLPATRERYSVTGWLKDSQPF